MMQRTDIPAMAAYAMTSDFQVQVEQFRKDWYAFMKAISKTPTPQVDGAGKQVIIKVGQFDSIIIAYMKDRLNFYFPGWSWEGHNLPNMHGIEWVSSGGTLVIIDPSLLQWGIVPPVRRFFSTAAKRVTHKSPRPTKEKPVVDAGHTPETIVDLKNDMEAVNTLAFKKAISMLTGIGDDIYGKRIEEDGMGSYLEVFLATPSWDNLMAVLPTFGLDTLSMLRLLGCQSPADLDSKYTVKDNYLPVYEAILAAKGGGKPQ